MELLMLTRADLANYLQACIDAEVSLNDFEDWFEEHSWNVHRRNDEGLTTAVFRIESWLTAWNEGRLSDEGIRANFGGLVESTRPFAALPVTRVPSVPICLIRLGEPPPKVRFFASRPMVRSLTVDFLEAFQPA